MKKKKQDEDTDTDTYLHNILDTPPSKPKDTQPSKQLQPISKDTDKMYQTLINMLDKWDKPTAITPQPVSPPEEEPEIIYLTSLIEPKAKKVLSDLKYWDAYPLQIRKWLIFTKSAVGAYDEEGRWFPLSADPIPKKKPEQETKANLERIFVEEQASLPPEFRGHFRFGITYDEIKDSHPKIRRLLSLKYATTHEILQHRKRLAIIKWGMHETDTASDPVQIDILTQRIRSLRGYVNRKDQSKRRALEKLIKRRKSLMQHLKKRDVHTYFAVLREIKLKDMYHVWDMRVF